MGSLSQAPITLSDIDKISEAFATVLNGVFHERIEYPDPPVKRSKLRSAPQPDEHHGLRPKPFPRRLKLPHPRKSPLPSQRGKRRNKPKNETDLDKKQ